ncbi:hypothetical protein B0H15DRAFT_933240 [Mycena belliarum]|uniref:Chromo domain-containing protein n=1 Tax=Mycena belliarum TaxID=1033014 RepID=A0AAD6U065_9AGAR|nr:hypothetical protein B0H15DRAFT_933240 [Mycena belliae]
MLEDASPLDLTHDTPLHRLQDTSHVLQGILARDDTNGAGTMIEPILQELRKEQDVLEKSQAQAESLVVPPSANTKSPMYGMPLSGVEPIEPKMGEFVWEASEYASLAGDESLPSVQIAAPSHPPPENCWYPQAPNFNLESHTGYRRQKVYWSDFYVVDKPIIRRRGLCTIQPPEIEAIFDPAGNLVQRPLPGMTRQIMGIPYIQRVDGNPQHTVTVAVAQTRESLVRFGNGIADKVEVLERELYLLAFGSNPNCIPENSILALYHLGLKRNDRSGKPIPGSNDGSYSLASTVEKGQGQGCFQPAVQTSTPEAQKLIRRTLVIVHELQQLIMPCCLSKFEWEMCRFLADDNNIFVFGGLGPGATGLQMNISSGMQNLRRSIGNLQGYFHTDDHDDPTQYTFGILMLKLPPGSDSGPFMFGRCGLYVREQGGYMIIYLIFRGNDLHSGFHPAYLQGQHDAWIEKEAITSLFNISDPEQRCFLVPYPNQAGCTRMAELSVTPPLTFMNLGAPVLHKLHSRNFSQHGEVILGSAHNRHTRLSREIIWAALNALKFSGITLDMNAADLFAKLKYRDDDNHVCTVGPPPFDVELDAAYIEKMRGYWAWHRQLSLKYLVRITRDMYKTVQACIKFQRKLHEEIFPVVERRPAQSSQIFPNTGEPVQMITNVIAREYVGAQVFWKLEIAGSNEVVVVPEADTEWLYQSPNCLVLADFIHRHIPLSSPALRKLYEKMTAGEEVPTVPIVPDTISSEPRPRLLSPLLPDERDRSPVSVCKDPLFLPDEDEPDDPWAEFLKIYGTGSDAGTIDAPGPDVVELELQDRGMGADQGSDVELDAELDELTDSDEETDACMVVDEPVVTESAQDETAMDCGESAHADSRDQGTVEEEEEEGCTYEIAGINDYRDEDEQQWHVRWKGYTSAYDSWLCASAFVTAKEMFDAYNKRHGIQVSGHKRGHEPASDDLVSDSDEVIPEKTKTGTLLLEASTAFQACNRLLSSSNLEHELRDLRGALAADHPSANIKLFNPASLLAQMAELNITNTWISSYLQYDSLSNASSLIRLAQLQEAVILAEPLFRGLNQAAILKQAIQWEIARLLLIVYEWLKDTAPTLVGALLLAHTRGLSTLNDTFPNFALLTDHVMLYVKHVRDVQPAQAARKTSKKGTKRRRVAAEDDEEGSATAADSGAAMDMAAEVAAGVFLATGKPWPPGNLNELPADLYGLRPGSGKEKHVLMPVIGARIYNTANSLHAAAHKCLLELLCRELVWLPMAPVDAGWNSSSRRKNDMKGVHARLISRGAVLQCIVDACGTEGILACEALFSVLTSPTGMFPKINDDERFMKAIFSAEETTLQPLRDKLASMLDDDPDVPFYACEIAQYIHHRTLELQQRHVMTEEQVQDPFALPPEQRVVTARKPGARPLNLKRIPVVRLSPEELVHNLSVRGPALFALPAVIIREALSKMRGHQHVVLSLRRILDGKNPATGTESRANLDHVNPARAASTNLQLLKEHIPPIRATTAIGLSNLLAWMLTGQGFSTSKFLSQHPFFFHSAADCISHFQDAQDSNAAVVAAYLADHSKAKMSAMKKLADFVSLDDPNVWGQASNDLSLNPTIRNSGGKSLSIAEKFAPCFTKDVEASWTKWLGDLAGKDPDVYTGPRHSWIEAISFIQSLGLNGVKGNGLTTLQLANNFVFLNICVEPSAAEMGAWIADNPTLGAFKGLTLLGFNVSASDPIATRVAFQVFYDHCDRFLSTQDKVSLGFGAIFVEHVLCKVQRWRERYKEGPGTTTLDRFALSLLDSAPQWVPGANLNNPTCFPFPPGIETQQLEHVIRMILDSR